MSGYEDRVERLTAIIEEERKVRDSSEYLARGIASLVRFTDDSDDRDLDAMVQDVGREYAQSLAAMERALRADGRQCVDINDAATLVAALAREGYLIEPMKGTA